MVGSHHRLLVYCFSRITSRCRRSFIRRGGSKFLTNITKKPRSKVKPSPQIKSTISHLVSLPPSVAFDLVSPSMARTIHLQPLSFSYALLPLFSRRATPSSKLHLHHNFSSINRPYSSKTINKPPLMVVSAKAKRIFSSKKEEIASPSDLLFESPLKIVEYPDPVLRAPNKKILSFDENLKNLVHEMFDIMYKTDGVGLAAPQVGMNLRLMVFNPIGERGEGEEIVLVNPRVQKYSNKIIPFEEGCLSFPGIYADVERPDSVKVDAQDVTGARFTVNLSGLPARVFQHEFDHLQGTLFFDRMTEEVVDGIRAELQALEKKYEELTGLPSPEKVDLRKRVERVVVGFGRS